MSFVVIACFLPPEIKQKSPNRIVNSLEIAATERKKALYVVQYLYDYYIISLIKVMLTAFPGASLNAGIYSDDWAHPVKQMSS